MNQLSTLSRLHSWRARLLKRLITRRVKALKANRLNGSFQHHCQCRIATSCAPANVKKFQLITIFIIYVLAMTRVTTTHMQENFSMKRVGDTEGWCSPLPAPPMVMKLARVPVLRRMWTRVEDSGTGVLPPPPNPPNPHTFFPFPSINPKQGSCKT